MWFNYVKLKFQIKNFGSAKDVILNIIQLLNYIFYTFFTKMIKSVYYDPDLVFSGMNFAFPVNFQKMDSLCCEIRRN